MEKTRTGLIILIAVILANISIFAFRPLGGNMGTGTDILVICFSFSAFLFGMRAYKIHGFRSIQGKALLLLSLGVFFWFLGESVWAYYDIVLGEIPIASYADAAWFAGYPLFAAGLYFVWKITRTPLLTKSRLSLTILSEAAISVLIFFYLIAPLLASPETTAIEKFTTAGYVIGDIILIAGCVTVAVSFIGGMMQKPWIIIASALIMSALADIIYSYMASAYEAGIWIDILWNADYLMMAYGFFYYRSSVEELLKGAGGKK